MTLSCKYHHDFNIPELSAFFFLQLLLPGNSQPGHLGASCCWLLAARVSDASPAARGLVGEEYTTTSCRYWKISQHILNFGNLLC